MRRSAGLGLLVAMLAVAGAAPHASRAATPTPSISEFSAGLNPGSKPVDLVDGPDGNLWFSDDGAIPAIGRITPAGAIAEFGLSPSSAPGGIATGPDGNLWFTDDGSPPAIGRVTPGGAIVEFDLAPGSAPKEIAAGADGNLWFSDRGATPAIGRITPAGAIREFGAGMAPSGIAPGADGNLWFTDAGTPRAIGRITTAGAVTEFSAGLRPGSAPAGIAGGPDGNVWFTDEGITAAIGSVTPAGTITEFTESLEPASFPVGIAAGADGSLWFTDQGSPAAIGRTTPAGSIHEFSLGLSPGAKPAGISTGPDGNIWFADGGATSAIGRVTTPPAAGTLGAGATGPSTGAVLGTADGHRQPTSFHVEYGPLGDATTTTREQNLGTTSGNTHVSVALGGLRASTAYQARLVVTNPTGTVAGAFVSFTTPAARDRITSLRISPRTLVVASRGGPVSVARRAGAVVSYNGTQPATTTFTVQRASPGRREGGLCLAPSRANRGAASCTRYVKAGSFKHADAPGANRFRFSGRVRHRKLPPGRYRLQAVPRSAAGAGAPRRVRFAVGR